MQSFVPDFNMPSKRHQLSSKNLTFHPDDLESWVLRRAGSAGSKNARQVRGFGGLSSSRYERRTQRMYEVQQDLRRLDILSPVKEPPLPPSGMGIFEFWWMFGLPLIRLLPMAFLAPQMREDLQFGSVTCTQRELWWFKCCDESKGTGLSREHSTLIIFCFGFSVAHFQTQNDPLKRTLLFGLFWPLTCALPL